MSDRFRIVLHGFCSFFFVLVDGAGMSARVTRHAPGCDFIGPKRSRFGRVEGLAVISETHGFGLAVISETHGFGARPKCVSLITASPRITYYGQPEAQTRTKTKISGT